MSKTDSDQATVNRKGARRIRGGHPWVYESDVLERPARAGVVSVRDEGGNFLGRAFLSPASRITLRMVTRDERLVDRELLRERVGEALERRRVALPEADAFRVVHGEADLLPGIFVDRYGDCVALQTLCAAADALEPLLIEVIEELLSPRVVVLRDDSGARAREGLPRHVSLVAGEPPARAVYHEGEIELAVDLLADQKTGSFLDQSRNHVAAGRYARGEALDCFTYHGGFALQLARSCGQVMAVDQSEAALERARHNAQRAGATHLEIVAANVFDLLPRLLASGRRFDTVVLDPPAFASTRDTVPRALRAYKEINLRAMKLLRPNGVLVSCSCSGRVGGQQFDEILEEAARDARRPLQILERRGAGPDHPVLAGVPETEYLKCRIAFVL